MTIDYDEDYDFHEDPYGDESWWDEDENDEPTFDCSYIHELSFDYWEGGEEPDFECQYNPDEGVCPLSGSKECEELCLRLIIFAVEVEREK
jgi:hypothetical protein